MLSSRHVAPLTLVFALAGPAHAKDMDIDFGKGRPLAAYVPAEKVAVGGVVEIRVYDPDSHDRSTVRFGRHEKVKKVDAKVDGPFTVEETNTNGTDGHVYVRATGAGTGTVSITAV